MDNRGRIPFLLKIVFAVVIGYCLIALTLRLSGASDGYTTLAKPIEKVVGSLGNTQTTHSTAPFSVTNENQAFWGDRPDARTTINVTNILEGCKGASPNGWRDTRNCVDHLRYNQDSYHELDTLSEDSCDRSNAIKYHTYWRGPLTSRVSFMLKSFLYTQNLKCAEMHLWLDADNDPTAVEDAMASPYLQPFLPLVQSGSIILRRWIYPAGVYIPRNFQEDDFGPDNMLYFRSHQIPRGPVAVSDSVRFIILHLEGGLYIDMDTMFLRDLRPLLITANLSFAERWGAHPGLGEYNTAYLRLQPNSSLSSLILQGASKMGVNFHPRVVGRMLAKTGFNTDLVMFETALFDPLWSEFDNDRIGRCCTPCLTDFGQFYQTRAISNEWITLPPADRSTPKPEQGNVESRTLNRTLSNFYRGAYTHHIHNQWSRKVNLGSWIWVADQTYNQFLRGLRPNPYGEYWDLPVIDFSEQEREYVY